MRPRPQKPIIKADAVMALGLFFFSGAFALVYEVSWVRAITLEFGSTTLAVSTVLAVFMSGLAIGAWLVRDKADQFKKPLAIYGIIELGIALYAFVTPFLFNHFLPLFSRLASSLELSIWLFSFVRFIASAIVLILPTILMGATLPVLTRYYANQERDAARGGGLLYGINTVGAFCGTIAAGFLLLPALGLMKTIYSVALANLILGGCAILLSRASEKPQGLWMDRAIRQSPIEAPSSGRRFILMAIFFTGFAAMAVQVVWTRVLILVIGGSAFAFSIVLATFLAALGLGAAVFTIVLRSELASARSLFRILSLLSATLIALTATLFPKLPGIFLNWFWSYDLLQNPGRMFNLQGLICSLIIFLPTFVMGGFFPTAVRIVLQRNENAGREVAQIYTWNTVGCILGSIAAGFALIPWLGIRGSLLIVIALYCLTGALIAMETASTRRRSMAMITAIGLFVVLFFVMPGWQKQMMTSAMYNYAYHLKEMSSKQLSRIITQRTRLLYYRDGLSATVTVTQNTTANNKTLGLTINGKYDGSTGRDMANQRLLAHYPLLLHPNPQNVCVIGMGTGCTAGSAALYPLEKLVVVEIEPAVVEASRFFSAENYNLHENLNVQFQVTDGRLYLKLNPQQFDVIISEPSNPWLAGPSDLFTRDFFNIAAQSLRSDGLFCQWLHLYALSPENVAILIRTFTEVFPNTFLISTQPGVDILLLGSVTPFTLDLRRVSERLQDESLRADLADPRVQIRSMYDLAARIRLGPSELQQMVSGQRINTDDHPIIMYRAPRDLYAKTDVMNQKMLAQFARGVSPYLSKHPTEDRELNKQFYTELAQAYQLFVGPGNEVTEAQKRAMQ